MRRYLSNASFACNCVGPAAGPKGPEGITDLLLGFAPSQGQYPRAIKDYVVVLRTYRARDIYLRARMRTISGDYYVVPLILHVCARAHTLIYFNGGFNSLQLKCFYRTRWGLCPQRVRIPCTVISFS